MTSVETDRERIQRWLRRSLGQEQLELESYRSLHGYSDCELVACQTDQGKVVLKRYAPGFVDYARLGPVATARKHLLVLQELPALGVPTPRPLGFATQGEEAALAMEWIDTEPLTPAGRLEAARVLARLHTISLADLSEELADLAIRSTPNRGRLGEVPDEPPLRETTLQHGDYFSVNFAATGDVVSILDWDFLACGDPMWDLAFLLNVESSKEDREGIATEAVIRAYREVRPFDAARLAWHLDCFRAYWRKRGQDA
jgi:aminoglycoside phosphotransferase (APT) family kinase protein